MVLFGGVATVTVLGVPTIVLPTGIRSSEKHECKLNSDHTHTHTHTHTYTQQHYSTTLILAVGYGLI